MDGERVVNRQMATRKFFVLLCILCIPKVASLTRLVYHDTIRTGSITRVTTALSL